MYLNMLVFETVEPLVLKKRQLIKETNSHKVFGLVRFLERKGIDDGFCQAEQLSRFKANHCFLYILQISKLNLESQRIERQLQEELSSKLKVLLYHYI